MPRIRKKTTKRGSTNQREKIKHKAAETRKKRKKELKKKPQWKSKQPKDPGIPNNFPYKDQILAEIAEERRKVAEEKEQRKQQKKAAKAGTEQQDGSDGSGSEAGFDGVRSLSGGAREKVGAVAAVAAKDADAAEADEDVPMLLNPDLPNLKSVLDTADVVIQVLDARDPLRFRSTHVEEAVQGKKTVLVLNKIDACPREAVSAWAATLRAQHPTVLFRSASAFLPSLPELSGKGKGKARADDAWGVDSVLAYLRRWAEEKGGEPLVVAVVGVTNAGKSSFVNSLLRKAALPTYEASSAPPDRPTTTPHPQEVVLDADGKQLRLIDTPGLAWQTPPEQSVEELERSRARDILLRNRGRIERLKDPAPVLAELVSRIDREDLMLFYNLPAFADGNADAFLAGVARSHSLTKKGGAPDLAGASRIVLRDWSTGKFPRYTTPLAPAPTAPLDSSFAEVYAKDGEILGRLPTRKELRKGTGVVKMKPGEPESRRVVLDVSWAGETASGNESDIEDEGEEDELADDALEDLEGESDRSEDSAEEVDEDSDEEDEEAEPAPPAGKRKRAASKASAPPPHPVKKVAFAAEPKNTKQARSAAGAKGARTTLRNAKSKADDAEKSGEPPAKAASKRGILAKPAKLPPKQSLKQSSVTSANKKAAISSFKKTAAPSIDGEEAYDFKQFF